MGQRILILALVLSLSLNLSESETFKREFRLEKPSDWAYLLEALIHVESEGNRFAVGASNDVGILQITPIYVREVNRILKEERYDLSDRTNIYKSLEMFEVYQEHHNPDKDILTAIKLHNPGAGKWYTEKVMNKFKKLKT
jgi:hypothetical protein